ncbi:MAG TPA: cupredoxin family copper-binding protein [Pseudolabrys sp.]|jgi:plastocyanin|nr:cupredoxin family copper-binding protein [Pseudolabrys sp.]
MTLRRNSLPVLVVISGLLSVSARAETIQVTIDKLVFAPAEVNAKIGDTIEWVNKDSLLHNAKATNGDWTVNLPPKQNGQVVLKKAGTIDYSCTFHPNMKGRIIVAPAS